MVRIMFKCKSCKRAELREYGVLRTETYGPGGMYTRWIHGRVNEYGREVKAWEDGQLCCKRYMQMDAIKGTKTEHVCDERCTEAKGHKCECSCGGDNHGIAHKVTA